MDWNAETIRNFEPLRWYEYLAIYHRKRSNVRSSYLRCAYAEYSELSPAAKTAVARTVTGDATLYCSDITVAELVLTCWDEMGEDRKMAWGERAEYLNSIPTYGNYQVLPNCDPVATDGHRIMSIRHDLKLESDLLRTKISSSLKKMANSPSEFKRNLYLPQKVQIENLTYTTTSMSPLFSDVLFGRSLAGIPKEERFISSSKKKGFLHLASCARLHEVMTLDGLYFCKYQDYKRKKYYTLTSLATLEDGSGHQTNAYGWSESDLTVTFVHNHNTRKGQPSEYITFLKPEFEEVFQGLRKRRLRRYRVEDVPVVGGIKLAAFTPTCLCSTPSKSNVVSLGAKLCYTYNDGTDSITIDHDLCTSSL